MAPPRQFDRARLAELHAAGLTGREIAARLGVTRDCVYKVLRGLGLTMPYRTRTPPTPGEEYPGTNLTPLYESPGQTGQPCRRSWVCRCGACGGTTTVQAATLMRGGSRSCGCLRADDRRPARARPCATCGTPIPGPHARRYCRPECIPPKPPPEVAAERRRKAGEMRSRGMSLIEIGDALGITRERVRQLLL